eukprot:10106160-Alexandrium_andersonii.AAC.1
MADRAVAPLQPCVEGRPIMMVCNWQASGWRLRVLGNGKARGNCRSMCAWHSGSSTKSTGDFGLIWSTVAVFMRHAPY